VEEEITSCSRVLLFVNLLVSLLLFPCASFLLFFSVKEKLNNYTHSSYLSHLNSAWSCRCCVSFPSSSFLQLPFLFSSSLPSLTQTRETKQRTERKRVGFYRLLSIETKIQTNQTNSINVPTPPLLPPSLPALLLKLLVPHTLTSILCCCSCYNS